MCRMPRGLVSTSPFDGERFQAAFLVFQVDRVFRKNRDAEVDFDGILYGIDMIEFHDDIGLNAMFAEELVERMPGVGFLGEEDQRMIG